MQCVPKHFFPFNYVAFVFFVSLDFVIRGLFMYEKRNMMYNVVCVCAWVCVSMYMHIVYVTYSTYLYEQYSQRARSSSILQLFAKWPG